MKFPREFYSRDIKISEEERKKIGLEEGEWEEVFPIYAIPVFKGDIIQKGKLRFVKIK